MKSIDWKRKLSSRKFWALVVTFVTAFLFAFNFSESEVTQVASIITAGGAVVAYILGESYIDASQKGDNDVDL